MSAKSSPLVAAVLAVLALTTYPALYLLSQNANQVEPEQVSRSIVLSVFFGILVLALLYLVVRDWVRAALIACGAVILFFSYGHVYELQKAWLPSLARHRLLVPIWGLLLVSWAYWVWRRSKANSASVWVLALIAFALLLVPVVSLSRRYLTPLSPVGPNGSTPITEGIAPQQSDLPDVYFIILDGYGRQDVLAELFDYDNSEFISALEAKGFTVADESWSNYGHTSLSLAATLNLDYVNDLAAKMDPGSRDLRPLGELIENSVVRRTFDDLGYQFVAFETDLAYTSIDSADIYMQPDYSANRNELALLSGLELNEFEGMFLESTIARVALDHYLQAQTDLADFVTGFPYQKHRDRVLFTISSLSEFADRDGEFLIFAHVISPHPPFVFGSNGEQIPNASPFSLQDDGCCTRDEYIRGYREQAEFISNLVNLEVSEILARSETPPIIIIQGDHGPGAFLASSVSESNLRERFGILNGLFLPGVNAESVKPSISPVNTFRLILREYFDLDLELLPDRSFFSPGSRPYDVTPVDPG